MQFTYRFKPVMCARSHAGRLAILLLNYTQSLLWPLGITSTFHQLRVASRDILTIADYFSKWVEAIPTAMKQASVVAAALFKVVLNFEQQVEV